jgi:hypothetical protein
MLREYLRLISFAPARDLAPGGHEPGHSLRPVRAALGFKPALPRSGTSSRASSLRWLAHLSATCCSSGLRGQRRAAPGPSGLSGGLPVSPHGGDLWLRPVRPDSMLPLVGASGAIRGCGALLRAVPPERREVFVFLFPFLMTTILLPARRVLLFYLVLDNCCPSWWEWTRRGLRGPHGGFLAGWAIAPSASPGPPDRLAVARGPAHGFPCPGWKTTEEGKGRVSGRSGM